MKCQKCGSKSFAKKEMKTSGIKGKCKYFIRYWCPVCSLNPEKTVSYS